MTLKGARKKLEIFCLFLKSHWAFQWPPFSSRRARKRDRGQCIKRRPRLRNDARHLFSAPHSVPEKQRGKRNFCVIKSSLFVAIRKIWSEASLLSERFYGVCSQVCMYVTYRLAQRPHSIWFQIRKSFLAPRKTCICDSHSFLNWKKSFLIFSSYILRLSTQHGTRKNFFLLARALFINTTTLFYSRWKSRRRSHVFQTTFLSICQ